MPVHCSASGKVFLAEMTPTQRQRLLAHAPLEAYTPKTLTHMDQLEKEMGKNLFYLASICNTLDLNLYDIIIKEQERVKMLGQYNLR